MVTKSNIVPNYVDKQIPVEEVKIEEGKEIKTISYKTQRVQEGTKSEDVQVREINWIATFVLFMLIIPVIL